MAPAAAGAPKPVFRRAAPVRSRRLALGWAALALIAIAACDRGSCAATAAGPPTAPRVVSLSPNTTEAAFALDAGHLLVGRSRHCDFPREAAALPAVGGFADPSVEAIVALRPTLVVGARGPAGPGLAQALHAHGIETYFPAIESVADVSAMIAGLGERLDRAAQARRLAERLAHDVEQLRAAAAELPPVRVAFVIGSSPIVVAGPGGFPDELLRLAGGHNVIDRGGPYPTVGLERLLALDPEVIVDATVAGTGVVATDAAPSSTLVDKPGWAKLAAVRRGRVSVLSGSSALRPGPRIAEGLAEIARALHDRDLDP